jgi:hypothetical protein
MDEKLMQPETVYTGRITAQQPGSQMMDSVGIKPWLSGLTDWSPAYPVSPFVNSAQTLASWRAPGSWLLVDPALVSRNQGWSEKLMTGIGKLSEFLNIYPC